MEDHGREPREYVSGIGEHKMGGEVSKSAKFCGCDPGAHHKCEEHFQEDLARARALNNLDVFDKELQAAVAELQRKAKEREKNAKLPVSTGIGGAPNRATTFPSTAAGRKQCPVTSGVLDYFPDALVAIAHVSFQGNEQHNPGQPLHWARGKSTDEADALGRHLLQRGTFDDPEPITGVRQRHSAKLAWRALANLQKEIEEAGGILWLPAEKDSK